MSLKPRTLAAAALASLTTAGAASAGGSAPDKAACVESLDQGQSQQSARKLRDARASLLACTNEACPAVVREDCARLLSEVDAALPTIVLSAKHGGHDVTDASVMLDGERLDGALDGRSIAVDPGPHVARFERRGSAPVDVRLVVREGEKNRLVLGAFVLPRAPAPQVKAEGSRAPIVPIVLAGTGALALGGSFWLRTQADDRAAELRGSCAPACDQAERDALSDKLVLANVSLAIGLGALAVSAVTWVLDSKR